MDSSALSFIDDRDTKFVKEPTVTFLVVLGSQEQIKDITVPALSPGQHQAYYFVAELNIKQKMTIFEVQRYSRSVVEVLEIHYTGEVKWISKDPLSRRTNLQGISIRGSIIENPKYYKLVNGSLSGFFGEFLSLFQKQLNFTLDPVSFSGSYGSKSSNGSWNGEILKLMNNEVDFGKLKFNNLNKSLPF